MFFSGFADEAGSDIDIQIKAHKELGYTHIELRNVGGVQFSDVSETEFERICRKLEAAELKVSCFGSAIANWARNISADFQVDLDDLNRCVPRMQKLGCKFIRVMSWANKGDNPLNEAAWKETAISRMKELAKIAEAGGIILALENCDGWASLSAKNMCEFVCAVNSPGLKVVFDTGNAPTHGLNSLDFYVQVKPHIAYVHIKDSYLDSEGKAHFTYPNEGCGYVRQILTDILRSGYDGGFSIEPHLESQAHLGSSVTDEDAAAYNTYVEYGKRFCALIEAIQKSI